MKTIKIWNFKREFAILSGFVMLTVAFNSMLQGVTGEYSGTQPPETGDWIILNETYVGNETIVMNGDVIIGSAGKLTLYNCILKMNCSTNGDYKIQVNSSGELNLYYSTITNGTSNANYDFYFLEGSNGDIEYSTIKKCGYSSGGSKGLKIESYNVTILESVIQNNYNGIYAITASPLIINSTIKDNTNYGIYWDSGIQLFNDDFDDFSKIGSYNNLQLADGNTSLDYDEYFPDENTNALIHLNDGSGNTATDSSGNGIDGSITGASWTSNSKFGNYALSFDGNDDYINFDDNFDLSDGSVEMWFNLSENFNSDSSSDMTLFSKYKTQGQKEFSVKLKFESDDGKIHFIIINDDVSKDIYSDAASWVSNTWYHVAATWGSNGMKMYVNNTVQQNTDAHTGYWGDKDSDAFVGVLYKDSSYQDDFDGIIDEFRVSQVARTSFIGFTTSGNLTSELFNSDSYIKWELLNISKTEPDGNHYIRIDILNGDTDEVIDGFNNLFGTDIDISSIQWYDYSSLKLKAYFYGDGNKTPKLDSWHIEGTTTIYNNIIQNNSIGIYLNDISPIITENDIKNNTILGIKVMNATPRIERNEISSINYNSDGIYLENSYPLLINNTIHHCNNGVLIINSPSFGDAESIVNNTLYGKNVARNLTFTQGNPPTYTEEKTIYIEVPNPKYSTITNANIDLQGILSSNFIGIGWNASDTKISVNSTYGRTAIAAEGKNIYAVWEESSNIYFNQYNGSNWGTTNDRVNNNPDSANSPAIAVDNGTVYVVWEDDRNGDSDIYFNKYSGGSWGGSDDRVNTDGGTAQQLEPTITADNDTVYVAWEDNRDYVNDYDIYFNKYDGSSWGLTDTEISNDPGANYQCSPSIATENDEIFVVWEDNRSGNYDIYFNMYDGNNWGISDVEVSNDPGSNEQTRPSVAVENGKRYVVWHDDRNGNLDIFFNKYDGSDWETDDLKISHDPNDNIQNASYSSSIAAYNGNITVVWHDERNDPGDIYINSFNGSGWDNNDFEINNDGSSEGEVQINPTIAISENDIFIVWTDSGNGTFFNDYKANKTRLVKGLPTNPYLDVGNDGDVQWKHKGIFDETEQETTENFASELNTYLRNLGSDPNEYVPIPLEFHSDTGGGLNITNIRIVYDLDPPIMVYNSISNCNVSLYLNDTSAFVTYQNIFNSNNVSIKCYNSSITLEGSQILMSAIYDFYLIYNSNLTVINTNYDEDKLIINDTSNMIVKWYLHIKLIDTNSEPLSGKTVNIIDAFYKNPRTYSTGGGGWAKWFLLTEVEINQSDRFYYTPHRVTTDGGNNINLVMDTSKEITLYYGNDSDLDGYPDKLESNDDIIWFEAEHHVYNQSQIKPEWFASNGKTIIESSESNQIINDYFPLNGNGTYKYYIRARTYSLNEINKVKILLSVIENNSVLINNSAHKLLNRYRWFSTPGFTTTKEYLRLFVNASIPTGEHVYIDKIMLVRLNDIDGTPTNVSFGQIADQLNRDTDFDWISDGVEIRNGTYWWEAEDFCADSYDNQSINDVWASNAKAINCSQTNNEIINVTLTPVNGTYKYYVKARKRNELETTPTWTYSSTYSSCVAWGDVDNDGDLDLATGIDGGGDGKDKLFINKGGKLDTSPIWESSDQKNTHFVAWGDVDNDGDLDLAAGNYGNKNVVYYNINGTLETSPSWESTDSRGTKCIAWGDVDNDGDLDLAIGNYDYKNQIYFNTNGVLEASPSWESDDSVTTYSISWGDVDNDGYLDLAVGRGWNNSVYLNNNGSVETSPSWISNDNLTTKSIDWGDVDNDGDLDLAAGNYNNKNVIYYNFNGTLETSPSWQSYDSTITHSVTWGDVDNDGNLDLAATRGNEVAIYYNINNNLETLASWKYSDLFSTYSTTPHSLDWGDLDGDGDLELAGSNHNGGEYFVLLNSDGNLDTWELKLNISGNYQNDVAKTVELTNDYEWYPTEEFKVTGEITLQASDFNNDIGRIYVDKVMLVNISQMFIDEFSDEANNKTINFNNGGYNNSVKIKLPQNALVTKAIMDIYGSSNTEQITSGSTTTSEHPSIYKNKIVYSDNRNATTGYDIYLFDMSTNQEPRITNSTSSERYPSIYDNRIVWQDNRSGNWDIFMFDINTNQTYNITNNQGHQTNADIWGDFIVWQDDRNGNNDIYAYNLTMDSDNDSVPNYEENASTGGRPNPDPAEFQITIDGASQINPAISQNRIVWQDYRNGNWDIYLYDLAVTIGIYFEDRERVIVTTPQDQINPDIFEDRIVWEDYRVAPGGTTDSAIYLYDLFTETEIELYNGTGTDGDKKPIIWGDKVVWEHNNSQYEADIYSYDLSVDSDWDRIPNYLENQNPTSDPAILEIATNNSNQINPSLGGDIVTWEVDNDIYQIYQNYILDVGDDGGEGWNHTELFSIPEATNNLANELNEYLSEHQEDASNGYIEVPLNFTSNTSGYLKLTNLSVELEFLIDPLDSDTDGDSLGDGDEIVRFGGYDIIEFEDTTKFKEWKNPFKELNVDKESNAPDFEFKTTDFIHQTGITLKSSQNLSHNEGIRDSWVKLRTHINESGNYKFKINPKLPDVPVRKNRVSASQIKSSPMIGYISIIVENQLVRYPVELDTGGGHIRINNNYADYLEKILENATYINLEREGSNSVTPENNSVDFEINIVTLRYWRNPNGSSNGNVSVYADLGYTSEYELNQHTDYLLTIGLDLSRVPKELLPEYKDDPTVESEVPDNLPWDNVCYAEYLDLDCIRVERRGLNPLARDTDKDGLDDGFESFNNSLYALNPDADGDGVNDWIELYSTKTNLGYRDSDYDGIRDGVECGFTENEILNTNGETKSTGSWMERIAHSGSPYYFYPINNWDEDNGNTVTNPLSPDTDNDGLPDGWVDGWNYNPSPILPSEVRTYHTTNNRYRYLNYWRYDETYWAWSGIVDDMMQIYEGEDLNLDGSQGSGSWGFNTSTCEYISGQYESNPCVGGADTDEDGMADGFEVWFSHLEPHKDRYGNYILNPTDSEDAEQDLDVEEVIFVEPYDSGNDCRNLSEDEGYYALAQRIICNEEEVGYSIENISKIAVRLNMSDAPNARMEIWYGDGTPISPIRKPEALLTRVDSYLKGEDNWVIFDVPDDIFKLNSTFGGWIDFYIVIRYLDHNYSWNCSPDAGINDTVHFQDENGNWDNLTEVHQFDYRLYRYEFEQAGDHLYNLMEYVVGTNPKDKDTDSIELGKSYNDSINDSEELDYDPTEVFPGTSLKYPQGGVIFRTSVEDGAIKFDNYGMKNYEWIEWDGDGERGGAGGNKYVYETTFTNPSLPDLIYDSTSPENNTLLFELDDRTTVYLSPDATHDYIFIWSPFTDLYDVKTDSNNNEYILGTCHVFNRTEGVGMNDYGPSLTYRFRELYLSNPFDQDSDNDGIKDGMEIDWKETKEENDANPDTLANVRDSDSDNDGLWDGEERGWMVDTDGDGKENMIDKDSDNDYLWDGNELNPKDDTDYDGQTQTVWTLDNVNYSGYQYNDGVNMLDRDSDGDGLADGWIDGKIWNWTQNAFVDYDEDDYKLGTEHSNEFDAWEGEDLNVNGTHDDFEPSSIKTDTDNDQLWDGYDIIELNTNVTQQYGELYDSDAPWSGFNNSRPYQSSSSNQSIWDTDEDGISDGQEVYGWYVNITSWAEWPDTSDPGVSQIHVTCDPNDNDTDDDNLFDNIEYRFTNASDSDTDDDGLTDDIEDSNGNGNWDWNETNPLDRDTDNDHLCDGWNDVSNKGTRDPSEYGEDIDGDGEINYSAETDPLKPDSDEDEIIDGIEYWYLVKETGSYTRDSDNDGTIDLWERDSDSDGLFDCEENFNKNDSCDANEPNATLNDTDGDGLLDGAEMLWMSIDNDSNDDGIDDYDQTYVIFRTNAPVKSSDSNHWKHRELNYHQSGNWIAIDKNGANISNQGELDLWQFNYNSDSSTKTGDGIQIEYEGEKINVTTPEGYPVYFNSTENIVYIETDENTYAKYGSPSNPEDGEIDNISSQPEAPDGEPNYVVNHQETYDYRVAIDQDSDNDGINNSDEQGKTDPFDADTDDDGILDGSEPNWDGDNDGDGNINANDTDSDNDGLKDGLEMGLTLEIIELQNENYNDCTNTNTFDEDTDPTTVTDMLKSDTDSDGWKDGNDEDKNSNGKVDSSETDPLDDDTDDDGIVDGDEADYGADPLKPDTDSDGIYDGTEIGLSSPQGQNTTIDDSIGYRYFYPDKDPTSSTDPDDDDTDDDGLLDGTEDANHDGAVDGDINDNGVIDSNEYWAETNPDDWDSDDDGLNDGLELGLTSPEGHNTSDSWQYDFDSSTTTDPLDDDTDEDDIKDGTEDTNQDGAWNATLGGTGTQSNWGSGGETDPTNPDSDGDGALDYNETSGWNVTIYREANPLDDVNIPLPNGRTTNPFPVTSDPIDNDTDDDYVLDGIEWVELADPRFADSDGDGYEDRDEAEVGSTLAGIEGNIPTITKPKLDKELHWKTLVEVDILGYKKDVSYPDSWDIYVEFTAMDACGIGEIEVIVDGESKILYYSDIGNGIRDTDVTFDEKINRPFDGSYVIDGWEIDIYVTDTNGNTGEQHKHLNSVIQDLENTASKAWKAMKECAQEWVEDRIELMMRGPVKELICKAGNGDANAGYAVMKISETNEDEMDNDPDACELLDEIILLCPSLLIVHMIRIGINLLKNVFETEIIFILIIVIIILVVVMLLTPWILDTFADEDKDGLSWGEEKKMGTSDTIPNIFVEIDYVDGFFPTDQDKQDFINDVYTVFFIHALQGGTFYVIDNIEIDENLGNIGPLTMEPRDGNNNDYWDIRKNHFSKSRIGIYHYCIYSVAHPTNPFVIGQAGISNDNIILYNPPSPAITFIHELGHNILGHLNDNHQQNNDINHCNNRDCIMWDTFLGQNDFCNNCWDEMDDDGVGAGVDPWPTLG